MGGVQHPEHGSDDPVDDVHDDAVRTRLDWTAYECRTCGAARTGRNPTRWEENLPYYCPTCSGKNSAIGREIKAKAVTGWCSEQAALAGSRDLDQIARALPFAALCLLSMHQLQRGEGPLLNPSAWPLGKRLSGTEVTDEMILETLAKTGYLHIDPSSPIDKFEWSLTGENVVGWRPLDVLYRAPWSPGTLALARTRLAAALDETPRHRGELLQSWRMIAAIETIAYLNRHAVRDCRLEPVSPDGARRVFEAIVTSRAAYSLQQLSDLAEYAVRDASQWLQPRKGATRLEREGMSGATNAAATFLSRTVDRVPESSAIPQQPGVREPRPTNQPWSPVSRAFFTRYLGPDELAWQHTPVESRHLRGAGICRCEDYAGAAGELAGWPGDYADGLEPTQVGAARVRDRAAARAEQLAREHGEVACLRAITRTLHSPNSDPAIFGHACVSSEAAASHLALLSARALIVLRVLADREELADSWCAAHSTLTRCALYAAYARQRHADQPALTGEHTHQDERDAASAWLTEQLAHALSPAGTQAVREVWDSVCLQASSPGASVLLR